MSVHGSSRNTAFGTNRHRRRPGGWPARTVAGVVAGALALVGLPVLAAAPAQAATIDMSGQALVFNHATAVNLSGNGTGNGSIVKYPSVGTVSGVNIDAVVTTTLTNATISNYDNPGSASSSTGYQDNFQIDMGVGSANGTASFNFSFYESGTYTGANTGTPVVLQNVKITSIDIDGDNTAKQFTDFTGFQRYTVNNPTNLSPSQVGTATRFTPSSASMHSNIPEDQVQVLYDSMSSISVAFGATATASTNYFGLIFRAATWGANPPTTANNPNNAAPTSTDDALSVASGVATTLAKTDFGTYSDADNNPFAAVVITSLPGTGSLQYLNGATWTAVTANQTISIADIDLGKLRFTGSATTSLGFKVNDGLASSTAAYTLTITVVSQSQTIAFTNPGVKTSGQTFASGATATSGLAVTLTSSTTGVCTVAGLSITTVAEGSCTIVATQGGDGTYAAAPSVTQTFSVSAKSPQTVTFVNPGDQVRASFPVNVASGATSSSGLTVTLASFTPSVCTTSGLNIVLAATGTCQVRASQAGDSTYAAASPVDRTFLISNTYAVTYAVNGGSGSLPSDTTATPGGSITAGSGSGLSRTGYSFTGWNTAANGSGSAVAVGGSLTVNANVTLYAQWVASYAITYHENGGTASSAPSAGTYFAGGATYTIATKPSGMNKTGYTFAGWNTQSGGSGTAYAEGASYSTSASLDLYAQWTATTHYTVSYNANLSSSGTAPSSASPLIDSTYTTASNSGSLTKLGYDFAGWNTASNGSGTSYTAGSGSFTVTGDVTLYAKWTAKPSYTVTYSLDASTTGSVPGSQAFTTDVGVSIADGPSVVCVNAGDNLVGWNHVSAQSTVEYSVGQAYASAADLTLYPVCSAALTWIVSYDTGGYGSVAHQHVNRGSGVAAASGSGLSRTGYTFAHWAIGSSGGSSVNAGSSYTPGADTTLYAVWTANTFDITYDANGGANPPGTGHFTTDGTAYSISDAASMTRSGYTFAGWNTGLGGGGTAYAAADSYSSTANLVLYAQWTAMTYTVSFNANGTLASGAAPTAQSFTVAAGATLPDGSSMTRAGHSFLKWNTAPGGGGTDWHAGDSYVTPGSTTLYAVWTATPYTVHYDANTGTGTVPSDQSFTVDSPAVLANGTGLSLTGYVLANWNTAANGSGTDLAKGANYATAGDITLYAVWTPNSGSGGSGGGGGTGGGSSASPGAPNVVTPTRRIPSPLDLIVTPTTQSAHKNRPVALLEFEPTEVALGAGDGATLTGNDKDAETSQNKGENPWDVTIKAEKPFIGGSTTKDPAAVAIDPGTPIQVKGYGFAPNTIAVVYVMDPPIALAVLDVDANGNVIGSVPIPSTLASGDYQLQVNGYSPTMLVRSLTLGFEIGNKANVRTQLVRTKVYFDSLSPKLTKQTSSVLAKLVRKLPKGAANVNVQVLGYVQPTAVRNNDYSLSSDRAMAVAKSLAGKGVTGKYYLSGRGRAPQHGATARRVEVVIAFTVLGN